MKLIVGLGNPGAAYRGTRHNVGFEVVDQIARRREVGFAGGPGDSLVAKLRDEDESVLLAKPLTFMNLSGRAVAELTRYFRIALGDVLVVTDDANLPLGKLRARAQGTDGGHNGLRSIVEALGTTEFARLRIGVGRGDDRRDLADHVLARFEQDEAPEVATMIERGADAAEVFVAEGIDRVMNTFNRADPEDEETTEN